MVGDAAAAAAAMDGAFPFKTKLHEFMTYFLVLIRGGLVFSVGGPLLPAEVYTFSEKLLC